MEAISYSTFRSHLRTYLDRTRDNAEPVLVTSKDPATNVVVINARDYDNLMETIRIYENPYLLDKIMRGVDQVRSREIAVHELSEDEHD